MARPTILFGTFNLEKDGFTPDGRGGGNFDRFYAAHEELSKYPFAALFRQETSFSEQRGGFLRFEAERMLGMRSFIAPQAPQAPSDPSNPPAVFVNQDAFRVVGEWPQTRSWWQSPAAVTVRYGEALTTIQLASVHLCYHSPEVRTVEARIMTTWQNQNQVLIAAGDFNSKSATAQEKTPGPDWPNTLDRTHQEHRTRDGVHDDTEPDQILTRAGIDDVALYAATHLSQDDALEPTASMYPEVNLRQGPPQRIDFLRFPRVLLPAVKSVKVVPLPEVSDHGLILVEVWADTFQERLYLHRDFDYRLPI